VVAAQEQFVEALVVAGIASPVAAKKDMACESFFVGGRANQWLKRTGCKSGSAPKKSMEEYALFGLGVAPVPAF
jgi:hypothetical protein